MSITKVFEIKLVGSSDVVKSVNDIKKAMTSLATEIAKTKEQLSSVMASGSNTAQVDVLNNKIKSLQASLEDLSKQRKSAEATLNAQNNLERELAKGADAEANAFFKLNQQYKDARANAQEMAAEFGVQSEQAIAAAQAADKYRQQLIEINQLVKSGGASAAAIPVADVPLTTNIEGLKQQQEELKKTGDVLSEYDRQQAEAAISATEFAKSQGVVSQKTEEIASKIVPIKGALDEYTGGLRDNIKAQIENVNAIALNRAEQKEIAATIKSSGVATRSQLDELAALKEEELLLVETNKQLTVTIRNQAKEFIASTGSIDEMQAQLNQLQQTYEMLSEAERTAPFGKELKAQIDVLEPRVREFEASIGRFSRNVGNYPSSFTGAFKVLSTELDAIKGKLVQGNFGAKEMEELARKEAVLANMTKVLGTTYATTAAESAAYKETARQLGIVFGTDSEIFKNFTTQVGIANAELKKSDTAVSAAAGAGTKASGAFQKFYGVLRNVANILPGIGIAGLIGLLLAPITAFASKLKDLGENSLDASDGFAKLRKEQELTAEALKESESEYVKAVTNVQELGINIGLAKKGFLDKTDVLKQYNETIGKVTGQVKTLDEAELALVKNGPAYIQMMLLKAAAQYALQQGAKAAFEAELEFQEELKKAQNVNRKGEQQKDVKGGAAGLSEFLGSGLKNEADAAKKAADKRVKTLADIAKKFQEDAAKIAEQFDFDFFGDKKKIKKPKGSKLDLELQEALKLIESTRLRQLAIENNYANEIQKVRDLTFDEEILHIKKVEKINVDALNKKIALFEKRRKLNNEEKKTLAEFIEQRSSVELDASKKIQDIEQKRFDKQRKALELNLQQQIQAIKDANDIIQNDPTLSQTKKAQAYLDADNAILAVEEQFYKDLVALNVHFNKEAVEKAKMGIKDIEKAIRGDRRRLDEAVLEDIRDAGEKQILQFKVYFDKVRNAILNNDRLTFTARKAALDKLARIQTFTIMSAELAKLELEFARIQLQYNLHLIAEKKFLEAKEALEKKRAEQNQAGKDLKKDPDFQLPSSAGTQKAVTENLNKEFGFEEGSKEAQLMAEIVQDSFSLAKDAMNSYFDAQRERIEQEKELDLERLDREKDRVKARATSAAEEETIERQFAQKRREIEKKAGEELKKQKRAEAKVALATELANIAASAAANVLNGVTFGVAGIIQYGILSGLALARYALNIAAINQAKFDRGGKVVPNKGGRFGGQPHSKGGTPFMFKGNHYEAEVDELSIIRTRNAPKNKTFTITGTQEQIASALNKIGGGIAFASGAKVKILATGGQLGTSLKPPVFSTTPFNASNATSSVDDTRIQRLESITAQVLGAVYSSDRKEVVLNPKRVTAAQKRNAKDVKLAEI